MSEIQIGERQTVDRAKHPTLGEGRAVYDNGPCFFLADSGEVEHFKRPAGSGSRSSPTRYSYAAFYRLDGSEVELETTDRESGQRHSRVVAEDGRAGWLVQWSDATSKRERFIWFRFEPEGGAPETMMIQRLWAGEKRHKSRPSIASPWNSIESVGGHQFTYRRESDAAPVAKLTRKTAPAGPMPGPNASREEITKWLSRSA